MQETTKKTMEELKEIPSEIRARIKSGTDAFLDRVGAPFSSDTEEAPPQHVVPREDQWAVVPQGAKRATKLCETKNDAFSAGQKTAKREGSVLIVHRQDGTVQEIRNYRNS